MYLRIGRGGNRPNDPPVRSLTGTNLHFSSSVSYKLKEAESAGSKGNRFLVGHGINEPQSTPISDYSDSEQRALIQAPSLPSLWRQQAPATIIPPSANSTNVEGSGTGATLPPPVEFDPLPPLFK